MHRPAVYHIVIPLGRLREVYMGPAVGELGVEEGPPIVEVAAESWAEAANHADVRGFRGQGEKHT